jgi:predicted nucleotidyltransferase
VNPYIDIPTVERQLAHARAAAHHFATALRNALGDRVRRIVLYGSLARDEWTPESDIDVLVLTDTMDIPTMDTIVKTAYQTGLTDHDVYIQPLPMAEADFNEMKRRERMFPREVERTGIAL